MWTYRVTLLGVAALALASCSSSGAGGGAGLRGDQLEVLAVWSGVEQQQFEGVIADFERRTGVHVTYTSAGHGVPANWAPGWRRAARPMSPSCPNPGC